jgi:alpha-beta hydrolase superfamily lysophospholipase
MPHGARERYDRVDHMLDSTAFNERLFFPRTDFTPPPDGATDRMIEVPGARLHMRMHRAEGAKCTLLLFHGNGEVVSDYDDVASSFANAGASLAIVDYRGYGASTGVPTLRSIIADAPLVLRALSDERPLVVMGRSLGSACAAELYAARPREVASFVWESGAADLVALVRRRGFEPSSLVAADVSVFDPIPKLERGTHPLLVLHGEADTLISCDEGRRAFDAAGTREKRLVTLPGFGHNNVSFAPAYWSALAELIARSSDRGAIIA